MRDCLDIFKHAKMAWHRCNAENVKR